MATSTGKIIGIIALVALIVLIGARFSPFMIMAPISMVTKLVGQARSVTMHGMGLGPAEIIMSLLPLLLVLLWIWAIIWVYRDAEKRGMSGALWALLVFVGSIIGLIIYLIIRNENLIQSDASGSAPCPGCEKPVSSEYVFCPHCGKRLQAICPGCEKPVEDGWKVCPQCGKKLTGSK
jgi:hypothetical protein